MFERVLQMFQTIFRSEEYTLNEMKVNLLLPLMSLGNWHTIMFHNLMLVFRYLETSQVIY